MSWIGWLLFSALAAGLSIWHYRSRETPGRGRVLLALLRAGALALLLLLVMDPELPAADAGGARGTQVLLDASLSMQLPVDGAQGAATRWQQALAEARKRSDGQLILFGDRPRPADVSALTDSAPGDARSRLLPALQAAAEAGVRRVVVITDGGIEDADAVARWIPRLGLQIETEVVGAELANIAITEATAPQWVQAGSPAVIEFGVTGVGAGTDSIAVVATREGRVLGRTRVAAPAAGRIATGRLELRLESPPGGGWVPLQLALETADAVPDDNRRDLFVQVSDEPAAIAIVSFRPDWEPRFLAPVLEQALGLPLRGYLRGATGQYVRLAGGLEAGAAASEQDVQRAVERAEVVVLHGLGIDAPAWAVRAAGSARRVLIFPADDGAAVSLPVPIGAEMQGDFFPAAAIPASPIAPLLSDVPVSDVSPLTTLRTADLPEGAWAALHATRGRQGPAQPLVIAGGAQGRRWAIALGSGYWQWAFRGGAERQLYTRLWSALGGWLASERGLASLAAVRPGSMTVPRGLPVPWVTPGLAADSVSIRVTGGDGVVVMDTTVAPAGRDSAFTIAPAPGRYSYSARAFSGANVTEASGVFAVEQYAPELSRGRADFAAFPAAGTAVRSDERRTGRGRPLHATAYPYVAILLLLIAEWILRRRWGLR